MKINPDRVSKFIVIDGPRGAGKSLYMSALIAYFLMRYRILRVLTGEERRVWSNYPVGFWWDAPTGEKIYLASEPLNKDTLVLFEKELAYGWMFIDEMDQWLDKQNWMSVTQKLINKGLTQIRKRKLSLGGTLQDANWLNGRTDFQVDTQVSCRESAFTPWGRKQDVDLGEVSFLTFRDKSGISTGYKYEENWKEYQLVFQGKRFQKIYNTDYEFDPMESVTKYKIKAPVKEIVYGGVEQSGYDDEPGALFPNTMATDGENNKALVDKRVAERQERFDKQQESIKYLQEIIRITAGDFKKNYNKSQIRVTDLANLVYEKANGLYSDKQIKGQLSMIKGLDAFVGTGNQYCKIGELVTA